jgi:2-polyprenyl-3-methyl-5-hydroxy-6-metoxy-1,4-benzoquinol methylase
MTLLLRHTTDAETQKCLVCHSDQRDAPVRFAVDDYPFIRCPICHFTYLGTKLEWEDKRRLNEQRYGGSRPMTRTRALLREDEVALSEIVQHVQVGRLLEIGCGDGGFLGVAKSQGWDVWGVELSHGSGQVAASSLGNTRVHIGTVHDCPYPRETFDVVVMKSVIEHLAAPTADLAAIRQCLKPGGYLYVLTPNIESFDARIYGQHWYALMPGDHLWFFSTRTLRAFLKNAGFEATWMKTTEAYEDVISGLVFAVRSVFSACARPLRSELAVTGPRQIPRTVSSGVPPSIKQAAATILEASRWLSLPWFVIYSHLLEKASIGACVRGVFRKEPDLGMKESGLISTAPPEGSTQRFASLSQSSYQSVSVNGPLATPILNTVARNYESER